MVDDLFKDFDGSGKDFAWENLDEEYKRFYLQNVQIYIGEHPDDYTKNTICPGGPYLDFSDD